MSSPANPSGDSIDDEPALAGMRSSTNAPHQPLPPDQSILDEPALAVHNAAAHVLVNADAPCPRCGYNRRGVPLGDGCPECGHRAAVPIGAAPTPSDMTHAPEELVRHSVFNEPHALPPQPGDATPRLITADWYCESCGYNLRGRVTGQACAECGHVQTKAPPPVTQVSYTNWLRAKIAATSDDKAWAVTGVAAIVGGVWAVLAAMFNNSTFGGSIVFIAVLIAPIIEEVMKVALAAWIVEVRPYLFKSAAQVRIAIIASGAMFGVLENVYYVTLVLPAMGAPDSVYLFRWVVCTALHITTTIISSIGVARVWSDATTNLREPNLDTAYPWLLAAIVLHGLYNGGAVLFEIGKSLF